MDKAIVLDSMQFVYLMFGFAGTLVIVWGTLWTAVIRSKTNALEVIDNSGFLRIVTVGFALSAVVILSLARILTGEMAGTIVSGIAGYVLGSAKKSSDRLAAKRGDAEPTIR